jgi:hypothetical protein
MLNIDNEHVGVITVDGGTLRTGTTLLTPTGTGAATVLVKGHAAWMNTDNFVADGDEHDTDPIRTHITIQDAPKDDNNATDDRNANVVRMATGGTMESDAGPSHDAYKFPRPCMLKMAA